MATNNEQWSQWKPIPELRDKKYHLGSILDNITTFELNFHEQNKNHTIAFQFGASVDAYRCTLSPFCGKKIIALDQIYGAKFCKDWSFFIVRDSEYLRWLVKESATIFNPTDYMHFAFITHDFVIDVVSLGEPQVQFINNKG